jgi:hypothetical protein
MNETPVLGCELSGCSEHRDTGGFGQPVRQIQHASGFLSRRTFRCCSPCVPGEGLRL